MLVKINEDVKAMFIKYPIYFGYSAESLGVTQKTIPNLFQYLYEKTPEQWCLDNVTYEAIDAEIYKVFSPFYPNFNRYKLSKEEHYYVEPKDLPKVGKLTEMLTSITQKYFEIGAVLVTKYKLEEVALTELLNLTDEELAKDVFSNFTHEFYTYTNSIHYYKGFMEEHLEIMKNLRDYS